MGGVRGAPAPRKARPGRAFSCMRPRSVSPFPAPGHRQQSPIRERQERAVMRRTALSILIAISAGLAAAHAHAADLKVLGAGPVDGTVRQLAGAFTRATGHTVEATFDTVGVVQGKLKAGETADVIILSAAAIDELDK